MSIVFVHITLNVKTVLFQTIQLSVSKHFSSIWLIDKSLLGPTIPCWSKPGSDGNKGVLRIRQSSSIIGTWPSVSVFYSPSRQGNRTLIYGVDLTLLQICSRYIL